MFHGFMNTDQMNHEAHGWVQSEEFTEEKDIKRAQ